MKIKELLTKDRFTTWLKNQSPQRRFKIGCENHCVVAQYLTDSGKDQVVVDGSDCYFLDKSGRSNRRDLPAWTKHFIDRFDSDRIGSPKHCLKLMAEA